MQQFARIAQSYPEKRPAHERRGDFNEIYREFAAEKAAIQASRCLQCGVPFCQVHCPLSNNIPDWLRLTAEGRLRDAYDAVSATNTFPEICGRICPQDRLCEGNCVVQSGFGALTIGTIEKYITETAFDAGWVTPFPPARENGTSVAIIGAGPAGLAAAEQLRRAGCAVTIYDRYDRVGGLMIYGIPNFKLDKSVMQRRQAQYEASGIAFKLGMRVGPDIPLAALRAQHDAVLIATGVYKAHPLGNVAGADMAGVIAALDYLTASNRAGLGDALPKDTPNAANKHVVVIGGGDTAMDCVRTAIRQGAKSVTCLYRRNKENMPGSMREVHHAEEEGVTFAWLHAPHAFHGENGRITSVEATRMRLGVADSSGRKSVEPIAGDTAHFPADMVITALGFAPEDLPGMFGEDALKTDNHGCLSVDTTLQTSLDGVYAAGDIVRGASLVVWAIADGREAAQHMLAHLAKPKRRVA